MENVDFNNLPNAVNDLKNQLDRIEELLSNTEKEKEIDDILTVSQAAEFLNLSVPTIYGYVQRRKIPVHKRKGTKRLYFSKNELQNWIMD